MSTPHGNGTAAWPVNGHATPVPRPGTATDSLPDSQPRVDWVLVAELRARVAERLEVERGRPGRELSDADEHALALSLVVAEIEQWALSRAMSGQPALQREAERALAAAVTAALFGLGRLQPLLDREDVENVHIHGADRVVLELADGSTETAPPVAGSDAELVELLTGWAARAGQTGREFSPAHPVLNLRLPAGGPLGSRLAAVMEVTDRPTVAIRRHRLARVTLADLVGLGTLSPVLRGFLAAAVRAGATSWSPARPRRGRRRCCGRWPRRSPAVSMWSPSRRSTSSACT